MGTLRSSGWNHQLEAGRTARLVMNLLLMRGG